MARTRRSPSRFPLLLGLAVALLLGPATAGAFKQADLAELKATGSCPWCDLSGATLSWANLSGATLSWANLAEANLGGANLTRAALAGAYLSGATLDGATWTDGRKCKPGSIGRCRH